MNVTIVIPARYASKRFPGKPLTVVAGVSLLERVWRLAESVASADHVLIATEDQRIVEHGESFGAEVVLTSENCRNGSERAFEALKNSNQIPDIVVNFQGDALLTPPWILDALIEELKSNTRAEIATPAVRLDQENYEALVSSKATEPSSGTLVVFDVEKRAMYFSKCMIPFLRNIPDKELPVFRHIGIYAYRYPALEKYLALSPGALEQVEGLEQLRALEHGMHIAVCEVDYKGRSHWSIDTPQDVGKAEQIITREGELLDI